MRECSNDRCSLRHCLESAALTPDLGREALGTGMTFPPGHSVESGYRLKTGCVGKFGRRGLISPALDRSPICVDDLDEISELSPDDGVDLRLSHG